MSFRAIFLKLYGPVSSSLFPVLFIIIAFFTAAEPALAQLRQLEITPVAEPPAGPVVFLAHPGRVVVIVRSTLTSLNFSSNMEIVEQRNDPAGGEYLIVLNPDNQILTVNAPGFMSQGIQLRGLQPNNRFYYSVEPVAQGTEGTLPVVIRVSPSAASEQALVQIDQQVIDISRPVELEPGIYELEIRAEGYRYINETIEISRERIVFDFALEQLQEQVVRIRTNPPEAMVFLNGVEYGTTDPAGLLELFRLPGSYELGILLSGHQSVQQIITVEEDSSNEFSFELERNTALLALNVEPTDARARVNQQLVDVPGTVELSAGTHRLEISREGYEPISEILVIERGQQIERTITLQAQTGGLQFRVNPSFANAEIRDSENREIERWAGIRRFDQLQTGTYTLLVSAEGYQPYEEEIEILKDEVIQKTIRLETQPDDRASSEQPAVMAPSLPSRGTAVTASILLPGSGHIYSGRNRGYLYLGGGLAAAGFAAWSFMAEGSIESDYNSAIQGFSSAGNFDDAIRYRNEAMRHYNDWNDLIDRRTIALAAFAGIYAIQLVDILISTPERGYRGSLGNGWQASATGPGIRLRYNFN